jgi:hypothetical protein
LRLGKSQNSDSQEKVSIYTSHVIETMEEHNPVLYRYTAKQRSCRKTRKLHFKPLTKHTRKIHDYNANTSNWIPSLTKMDPLHRRKVEK